MRAAQNVTVHLSGGCGHPGCQEPEPSMFGRPAPICNCPNMIVIPAGQHLHHSCPLHGEVVIHSNGVWC
jgi:hypothetical protein